MRRTLALHQCSRRPHKKPLLHRGSVAGSGSGDAVRRELDRLEALDRAADADTYAVLIRQCTLARAVPEGRRVHAHISKHGCRDSFLLNLLVQMFGRFGCVADASRVFDSIPARNCYSWNIMVAAFAQNGHLQQARITFDQMPPSDRSVISWTALITAHSQNGAAATAIQLFALMDLDGIRADTITFVSVIDACSSLRRIDHGIAVHVEARESGTEMHYAVATALASMYGKCRRLERSKEMFDRMEERNMVTVSWGTMIAAYNQSGDPAKALEVFDAMEGDGIRPDKCVFVSALEACGALGDLAEGRKIHRRIATARMEENLIVANGLIAMYGKCGGVEEARAVVVFDLLPLRDLAAWNAMITGYAQFGHSDPARELFDQMPERNVISWTGMISAYAYSGHRREAHYLFKAMDLLGQRPNKITYLKALEACAGGITAAEARTIHAKAIESGYSSDTQVAVGLLNLFEKCGSLAIAERVFDDLGERKTVVAWSIMISAYAQSGRPWRSLELFTEMVQSGVMPTEITVVNLLSACSHGGFLYHSWLFFVSMVGDYGLSPILDNYVCLVDILGRTGQLLLAQELLEAMPYEPNDIAWTSLLSSCKTQGDGGRGASVGDQVMDLCPKHSGPYRLVWNVCVGGLEEGNGLALSGIG
ncbi:hypothetical protein SELMODRAFT_94780 [Selaginella moellendorffii]|uniref:Pentacotripeptide-repeat region of PRORP domain-containing protein n=1 Tax=Selaginella moellendorffii TaxID=88036 RepID=D8RJ98_SELML|nr:hypothetical protein SELMODRAFT_94780 [Selaginella moellendorffii]